MPREISSLAELDQAVAHSFVEPVVIFKHSTTCGTSAFAHEEILDVMAAGDGPVKVFIVHVRSHRDVSNAVATRFKIRHESPQVLLVRDGQVVWSASHFRVTAKAIADKLRGLGAALHAGAGAGK